MLNLWIIYQCASLWSILLGVYPHFSALVSALWRSESLVGFSSMLMYRPADMRVIWPGVLFLLVAQSNTLYIWLWWTIGRVSLDIFWAPLHFWSACCFFPPKGHLLPPFNDSVALGYWFGFMVALYASYLRICYFHVGSSYGHDDAYLCCELCVLVIINFTMCSAVNSWVSISSFGYGGFTSLYDLPLGFPLIRDYLCAPQVYHSMVGWYFFCVILILFSQHGPWILVPSFILINKRRGGLKIINNSK